MAIFFKRFRSSLASHLVTAKLSPPLFSNFTLLNIKLSFISTSIADATANHTISNHHLQAENTPTPSKKHSPFREFLLNECGLSESEVSEVFRKRASIFGSTQTAHEAVQLLRDSGFTKDQVRKIILRCPAVICLKADRQLKPKIEMLGGQGELLFKVLLRYPSFMTHSTDLAKVKIDYIKDMGFPPKTFGLAISVFFGNSPEILAKKLGQLASFGLLKEEIEELIKKWPTILNTSIDKMQKNMDFFIHTAGLPANIIVMYPALFGYNLENRIKPRYAVFKFISEMQLCKPIPSLATIMTLGEQKFIDKYMKASPYATQLLEIYSGKSVDLDIMQTPE